MNVSVLFAFVFQWIVLNSHLLQNSTYLPHLLRWSVNRAQPPARHYPLRKRETKLRVVLIRKNPPRISLIGETESFSFSLQFVIAFNCSCKAFSSQLGKLLQPASHTQSLSHSFPLSMQSLGGKLSQKSIIVNPKSGNWQIAKMGVKENSELISCKVSGTTEKTN